MLAVVFVTSALLAILTGLLVVSEVIERALDADVPREDDDRAALEATPGP